MNTYYPDWDASLYATDLEYRKRVGEEYLKRAAFNDPCHLILGAEGKCFPYWTVTDKEFFDVTCREDWEKYFKPSVVHAVMAEHVFEHIEPDECALAFSLIYEYLRPSGYFLISVPDAFHPSPEYAEQVGVGGTGPGAEDHKVFWDIHTLRRYLEEASFRVTPLEYWDYAVGTNNALFHSAPEKGMLKNLLRTFATDPRNRHGSIAYTSLILLATKD